MTEAKHAVVADIVQRAVSSNPLKHFVHFLAGSSSLPRWALKLSTTSIKVFTDTLSGQALALNYFRSKYDPVVSPICPFCSLENETNHHFLFVCPHFQSLRSKIFGAHFIAPLGIQYVKVTDILSFIVHSDRFE